MKQNFRKRSVLLCVMYLKEIGVSNFKVVHLIPSQPRDTRGRDKQRLQQRYTPERERATSVCGLKVLVYDGFKLLVYEALRGLQLLVYEAFKPLVYCDLKLLVYEAFSTSV